MKWIWQYCRRYKANTILYTDRQTDKVKPVYTLQLRWAEGIIMFWWLSGKTNAITPITHWPSYAIWQQKFCVNIVSGNGLLPDGTKPLPQPMLTDHQWSPVKFILGQKSSEIHIRPISQEMPQPPITKICLKITCLKLHSNFPGANELT